MCALNKNYNNALVFQERLNLRKPVTSVKPLTQNFKIIGPPINYYFTSHNPICAISLPTRTNALKGPIFAQD